MNTTFFILSTVALLLGPCLYQWTRYQRKSHDMIDGFIFVVIGGIVCLDLVPTFIEQGGVKTLALLTLGIFLPVIVEFLVRRSAKLVHRVSLLLGASALIFHSILDGAALVGVDQGVNQANLAISVILHRFSVGLALWWLLKNQLPTWLVIGIFFVMVFATFLGQQISDQYITTLQSDELIGFQALVAGSVIHVLLHPIRREEQPNFNKAHHRYEGFGNMLGFVSLVILLHLEGHSESNFGSLFFSLLLLSAPALVLAFTLGGLLGQFLPSASIDWLNRGNSFTRASKGLFIGLPLPVCSCGVTPLYRSLIAKGLTPAGAIAFLVAGPELGIDALIISLPLLGGEMTIVRIITAVTLALLVSILMSYFIVEKSINEVAHNHSKGNLLERIRRGLEEGYSKLFDHTAPWILFGLIVAAALAPALEQIHFQKLPFSLDVLAFALLGIPIYVCASGATPVVAVLLASGLNPGAAVAFLLTGPATNIATYGVIKSTHGKRAGLAFMALVVAVATILGILVNSIVGDLNVLQIDSVFMSDYHWFNYIALLLLGLLFISALLRNGFRQIINKVIPLSKLYLNHQH